MTFGHLPTFYCISSTTGLQGAGSLNMHHVKYSLPRPLELDQGEANGKGGNEPEFFDCCDCPIMFGWGTRS